MNTPTRFQLLAETPPRRDVCHSRMVACGVAAFALGLGAAHARAIATQIVPVGGSSASAARGARKSAPAADCRQRTHDRLFFGLGTPDGPLATSEWERFLADVVSPRFPHGWTVVEANGRWRGRDQALAAAEPARVVEIAYDGTDETHRHIDEIVAEYRQRYRQDSVMLTRARIEVCF